MRNPRADAREPPKSFFFDAVFGDRSAQERVYEVCGAPLVESVLQGYNGTIFAYGQVNLRVAFYYFIASIVWVRVHVSLVGGLLRYPTYGATVPMDAQYGVYTLWRRRLREPCLP